MRRRLSTALALSLVHFPAPAAAAQEHEVGVHVLVFGETSFLATERDVDAGFSLGQIVGHLNAALTQRLSVFAEATVTPRATSFVPGLERVILRYDFGDRLKLSAGRYHTPVSWWNVAFHHGSWLQPSVARPAPVAFSTPLVPIHFLGLLAEGSVPAGPVTLLYDVGVGNGRQEVIGRPGDEGDDNGSRALLGGVRVRPVRFAGLEIGAHAYVDRVPTADGEVDERILSAHLVAQQPVELIAEYFRVRNEPEFGPGGTFTTDAWYLHAGYRLPPSLLSMRPYARYERIRPAAADPLFGGVAVDYDAVIAGVRWDFADFGALSAEYRSEDLPVDPGGSLVLNAAFVIPNLLTPR